MIAAMVTTSEFATFLSLCPSRTLRKGAAGWATGAASSQSITAGDGAIEFTATETTTHRMCGLSNGDANQHYSDIDYAIYLTSAGTILVYESGSYRGEYGTYKGGDRFGVSIEGSTVKYSRNGRVFYSHAVQVQYPLLVDTSMGSAGATITNTVLRRGTSDNVTSGTVRGANIQWLVSDQLGTPRMVIDKSGSLSGIKRHDYFPFGEEVSAGVGGRTTNQGYVSDNIRQKFTGTYERDTETGLDYAKARYYASTEGRFASPDLLLSSGTIYDPQTWNRYTYALNNPLKYVDPFGLYVFSTALGGSQTDDGLRAGAKTEKDKKQVEKIIGQRNQIRDSLTAAITAANDPTLSSGQRAEAQRAVNSYGTFNDGSHDNVVVGIVGNKNSSSETYLGIDGKINVNLNVLRSEYDHAVTTAHEGSHVADYRDYLTHRAVAYLGGTTTSEGNITVFETEARAYLVSSYIAQARGIKSYYPYSERSSEVWNKGWKENEREIKRVVGVFNRVYDTGYSASKPGPTLGNIPLR